MKVLGSKNNELNLGIAPEDVEIDRAALDQSLSAAGLDDASGQFWISIDRVRYKTISEVLEDILEKHGFAKNIENLLACLDTLRFGILAAPDPKKTTETATVAKTFLDVCSWRLPAKTRQGPFLEAFYKEIGHYDARIRELSSSKDTGQTKELTDQLREARKKLAEHKANAADLRQKVTILEKQLQQTERKRTTAERSLIKQNLLPPQLKLGKILSVDEHRGVASIRQNRSTHSIPLTKIGGIPPVGAGCVFSLDDNNIATSCCVFDQPISPFDYDSGTVCFASEEYLRIKGSDRKIITIKPIGKNKKRSVATGATVVTIKALGKIIGFHLPPAQSKISPTDAVIEEICVVQVTDSVVSGEKHFQDLEEKNEGVA